MKRIILLVVLLISLLLTACANMNVEVVGGADAPTNIIVSKNKDAYDAEKYFRENYVNEQSLPVLDIYIENPFFLDDRTLVLDDSIENKLENIIYEYYHNRMSGDYSEVKNLIAGDRLLAAVDNEEKQFNEGVYFSKIILDEIEVVDKEDIECISNANRYEIIELLNNLEMTEFAIIEVEKTVKLNEKYLNRGPQIGDGPVTRYFLLGKKDDTYKIVEVYWEGFLPD